MEREMEQGGEKTEGREIGRLLEKDGGRKKL